MISENTYLSSSASEKSTESEDSDDGTRQPRVRRVYNVTGGSSTRESDDALPSSNPVSDCDEDGRHSHSSVREYDMSTSESADTDSDDTGTVADKKSKRFSRVFVVNTNSSSSSASSRTSSDDETSSDSDAEDETGDNDSKTGVVLTKIKQLPEEIDCDVSHEQDKHVVSLQDEHAIKTDNEKICDNENICETSNENSNQITCENTKSAIAREVGESCDKSVDCKESCDFPSNNLVSEEYFNEISNRVDLKNFKDSEYMSPSPGLSDVSAESLNSSDVEQTRDNDSGEDKTENSAPEIANEKNTTLESEAAPEETHNNNTPSIGGEWNAGIRSDKPVSVVGTCENQQRGERAGAPVTNEADSCVSRHAARYTSLVMITQEPAPSYQQVSVVTSDTTTLVPDNDVIVRHTNWQNEKKENSDEKSLGEQLQNYFNLNVENSLVPPSSPKEKIVVPVNPVQIAREDKEDVTVIATADTLLLADNQHIQQAGENVTVITGADTLSAVVCLEEGLADDDSWVENLSHDEDEFDSSTPSDDSSSGEEVMTCSAAIDHEDELRGYRRSAIDFTLHTIVEESCEESEVEQFQSNRKGRPTSATDLEKYFFFGLGDGAISNINSNREDAFSETSSIYSEGMDSLGGTDDVPQNEGTDPAELASSRLEKYFLSGFMGFTAERRDSDGSVGSDSEGKPSPEQRRKRLVRARGTGRSHSSSLDNLLANADLSGAEQAADPQVCSEDSSSSDSDTYDESNTFEKCEGQFDTVKRKKSKKQKNLANGSLSPAEETKIIETTHKVNEEVNHSDEDGNKTPQPELPITAEYTNNKKQQSRDSGFIGSCDDLVKEQRDTVESSASISKSDLKLESRSIPEKKLEEKITSTSTPPATSLTRKDSFNNWSSDEETNLMMCKMRQFFKTMIANSSSQGTASSKPPTPTLESSGSPIPVPSPRVKNRYKPPQLVYFENELTRLMKTVPGIRDDQVREIVEYLSSEDTWSDSYDSSDYTSSDLEGPHAVNKSELQQQISDSCKQIINKFDNSVDDEGDEGDGGIVDESHGLNRETVFVYQKLVASFEKMAAGDNTENKHPHTPHSSPPLIAKVMHHIGSRLVALMHEVSSGESHTSNSPKTRHYHRRLQQKLSSTSTTTTEDDDSTSDSNLPDKLSGLEDPVSLYNLLPRSRSHDLLVGETRTLNQSNSGVSDIAEEREVSDCERFSWRGSFESALLATDSRNKLSLLGGEGSASASALAIAAKRRSAGDLLFTHKSLSREQLDRVRSCGSIGGGNSEDKLWVASATRPTRRRSSVPDASCGSGGSADGEDDDDDEEMDTRSTLPRSLQTGTATTNSLPRLPTNTPPSNMHKAQSMYHFLPQNVKSARYRPPGFNRLTTTVPKRAVSAPGLQPSHQRRSRKSPQPVVPSGKFMTFTLNFQINMS